MRHRKRSRKLGGDSSYRKSLLRNTAISLLDNEVIKLTLPRAKELRRFVEPLITLAKKDGVAHRRRAFALLGNKATVAKLFSVTAPRAAQRLGGYTRILKAGYRPGDNAALAYIELVDKETKENTTSSVQSKDKEQAGS